MIFRGWGEIVAGWDVAKWNWCVQVEIVQPVLIVERQNCMGMLIPTNWNSQREMNIHIFSHLFGGKVYFGSSSSSLSERELERVHFMPAAVTREGCVLGWGGALGCSGIVKFMWLCLKNKYTNALGFCLYILWSFTKAATCSTLSKVCGAGDLVHDPG